MDIIIRVTCAIIFHEGKVFAARRGPTQSQPFKWEFPGGKMEAGESESQCLLRELQEELGMVVAITERLPSFFHQYPDFNIELIPFVCELRQPGHLPTEHDQISWNTPGQLRSLPWSAADVPVMEYVLEKVYPRYS